MCTWSMGEECGHPSAEGCECFDYTQDECPDYEEAEVEVTEGGHSYG